MHKLFGIVMLLPYAVNNIIVSSVATSGYNSVRENPVSVHLSLYAYSSERCLLTKYVNTYLPYV